MAIGIYFANSKFSADKYAEALAQLEAAGAGAPEGRTYHVALETNGEINVFDVWESQAAFDAFGATLMPILTGLGVDPGTPMVAPVHNVIEG
jgi:quinol monooxygenase YgiN